MLKPHDLKKWMDRNNKTVADVASMTRVSSRTVERFLAGETEPRPIILEAFRKILEFDASDFQ